MSSYEVRQISQIDCKNIKLGKSFKYGDNYHLTNIYYNPTTSAEVDKQIKERENESKRQDAVDEKTKLIIQTPLMYIPNSMIYFNEKPFLELSFNNADNDTDVAAFKKWVAELEEYIFKLIKRRSTLGIHKNNLNSILKNGYNGSSSRLIVPINTNISKCIFQDDKKTKFLFNWEIPVPTYGVSIIWVKNVWVKKDKWGINLFMYASRVMNSHLLDPVDFMGMETTNKTVQKFEVMKQFKEDEKMSILVGQVPEYTMFYKMLKMGIPKDAVKQKMSISGADSRIIDFPEDAPYATVLHFISNPQLGPYVRNIVPKQEGNSGNLSMPPPPPPPPGFPGLGLPGPLVIKPPTNPMSAVFNQISGGGFKLKKIDPEEQKEKMKNKVLGNNVNTDLKVPSLMDIQGALARLKKVDMDNDSDV